MGDALTAQIRPAYLAKIDDHVYIHELSADERVLLGRPDVSVSKSPGPAGATAAGPAVVAPAYGQIPPAVDPLHESFIEIRDRETREVITVIELLSPTNKTPGSDREQYLGKRSVLLASNTHVVEIDLLRGGERAPVRDMPACDYVVMVSRSYERPRVELWPLCPIGPAADDPGPTSAGRCRRDARPEEPFGRAVRRRRLRRLHLPNPPVPPLETKEKVWAKQFLVAGAQTVSLSRLAIATFLPTGSQACNAKLHFAISLIVGST